MYCAAGGSGGGGSAQGRRIDTAEYSQALQLLNSHEMFSESGRPLPAAPSGSGQPQAPVDGLVGSVRSGEEWTIGSALGTTAREFPRSEGNRPLKMLRMLCVVGCSGSAPGGGGRPGVSGAVAAAVAAAVPPPAAYETNPLSCVLLVAHKLFSARGFFGVVGKTVIPIHHK